MHRWNDVARATGLIGPDGAVRPTIFAEMSALAARTGAVNLGQGFPDVDGPEHVAQAAIDAIRAGRNQYPPGGGEPELRRAIAAHQERHYGLRPDPLSEVLVTTGATEAIAATVLALVDPGDEVVTLEPSYDSYAAVIAMAGARHVTVGLVPAGTGFRLDPAALAAAVTDRTRLILLNSPHNPTGTVLTRAELEAVAAVARAHDLLVVTDEVYEHLTFDGARHVPIATLPGMAERTLTISSAGKSLSFTGWKVGWLTGPAALVTAVRTVQQFLTYVSGAPFQVAVASALRDEDGATDAWVRGLAGSLAARRDLLCAGLRAAGFEVVVPQGTYFVVADAAPLGVADGVALCRRLPELVGVVGVPVSAFCRAGSPTARALASRVRFTFVKREAVLEQAVERLAGLPAALG
ncbi:pyridoxal phosphate-dependent aminotransferase [Actinotalea sp.]|uniref:pyridoxal phosphate-dependent aminotransferase n=1 Tax=Actinotalea sp. TaxID=1872145 RepID=UPI002D0048B9|nr:pyridoxal phosphate-dependent aminotransferase [Actinotalea sp.]HQY33403.1 pyridoxal phosphate-dependent aminotransferase [Actinotalea sp.]HRA50498.1 pyridoxal phosphate-dependent aminotransferase [Actinotalea sp.]